MTDTNSPESTTQEPSEQAAPAAPESATVPSAAIPSPDDRLAALKKEAADNYDRYLRAVADMDNLRRRAAREKEEQRQFAAARVLEDLLPILDNLGLGLAAAKAPGADMNTLVGGIGMVADQLKAAVAGHGLKELNPIGLAFDPNFHEAISQQPSAEIPEGQVTQVVRVGYTLNGRLLRPASVIISSGSVKEEKQS